jgi:SAM-dependent methyltransferase
LAVERDDVVWAYRLLLGREPESEEAIRSNLVHADRASLIAAFRGSIEFANASRTIPVGLHTEVDAVTVETAGTPEQHAAMLDRIAAAWRKFGEEEPHWSVLTADEFRPDQIDANLERFYASGDQVVDLALAALSRNGRDASGIRTVLDYGCGVGRLSLAWAKRVEQVVGVDVSAPHVRLAEARAAETGTGNVAFRTIARLDDLAELPGCDLMFSQIVLQHNPPPVIAATLRHLLAGVNPGGFALFQVPTFIRNYRFRIDEYLSSPQAQMEMNPLPQREVFAIARAAGMVPLEVREDLLAGDAMMVSQSFLFERPAEG